MCSWKQLGLLPCLPFIICRLWVGGTYRYKIVTFLDKNRFGRTWTRMDAQHSFGVWLKRRRKGLDLTQADLAQQLDCSVAAVRKFEAEERRPSGNIVDRLATIFGIPTEERTAFLRFARGDWYFSPASMHEGSPWRAPDTASSNDSPANQPSYPTRHRSNLPAQLTSFVGRERELVEVRRLLETSRLVTLTGAGGSGKTRFGGGGRFDRRLPRRRLARGTRAAVEPDRFSRCRRGVGHSR